MTIVIDCSPLVVEDVEPDTSFETCIDLPEPIVPIGYASEFYSLVSPKGLRFATEFAKALRDLGVNELDLIANPRSAVSPLSRGFSFRDLPITQKQIPLVTDLLWGEDDFLDLFREALGKGRRKLFSEGFELGLFVQDQFQKEDGEFSLDQLRLFSRKLSNGVPIFFFADVEAGHNFAHERVNSDFLTSLAKRRVYVGDDTYLMMDELGLRLPSQGQVLDIGSGSAAQAIAACTLNPHISVVCVEPDARARNISQFNAAMNGISSRITVLPSMQSVYLQPELGPFDFVYGNPPAAAAPLDITLKNGKKVDISSVVPPFMWGGEDGLYVIRDVLKATRPLLKDGAPVMLFAQFLGDDVAPTLVVQEAEKLGYNQVQFKSVSRLPSGAVLSMPAKNWPNKLAGFVKGEFPTTYGETAYEKEVYRSLRAATKQMLDSQGVTRIHAGFLTLA